MSNLAGKTAYKALSVIALMVKEFERLHYMDMTSEDDWDATQAKNLLEGIVQSNNYRINYDPEIKKPLIKWTQ